MSLRVEVEFSPAFQSRLSFERLSLYLEENRSTLKGLLNRLVEEHGEKIKPLLFEKERNKILPGLMVMVNDRIFTGSTLNRQDLTLQEGDRVSLLYFLSGG